MNHRFEPPKVRPSPIEAGESSPPKKGAPPGRAAALLRQDRTAIRTVSIPRRRATAKAPHAFTATLAQAFGECLARVIVADSTGIGLLNICSRTLRVMTSAKRASCRWRRRTLKGGD